ncbi:MAG: hypothetical protein AB1813_02825 [Verrucomicrobiota bacterium]
MKTRFSWFVIAVFSLVVFEGMSQTVFAQPRFELPMRAGGNELRLQASGETGLIYSIQSTADFSNWTTELFTNSSSGVVSLLTSAAAGQRFFRAKVDAPNTTYLTNYHKWANSIVISNGKVEAIVVPRIGRVMQFRFAGEPEGPFWENRSMDGRSPTDSDWNNPGSFGGDKVWPAPQSDWNWPPPRAFDSQSMTGTVANGVVTLTSAVDLTFGIRVIRRIELHPDEPVMRISTVFEKRINANYRTNRVSIWVVTQLKDPDRVFMPVVTPSIFTKGYVVLAAPLPTNFKQTTDLISFNRDPLAGHKIGNDSGTLVWVGTNWCVRMDSPRAPGSTAAHYPDSGCSAEVWTNPNPAQYIELELLSPIEALTIGQTMERTVVYRLYRRTESDATEQALKILSER